MQPVLTRRSVGVAGALLFASPWPVIAGKSAGFSLAGTAFEKAGHQHQIDPLLLYSVALLESGYGHGKGTVGPWHLTLRSPRSAFYLDTPLEAKKTLLSILAKTSLVDVGAMQVNIKWNGFRVTAPTDLLDLATNIEVGASILMEAIQSSPNDLVLGLGRYHNWSDEKRARNYGSRVLAVHSNLKAMKG